MQIENSKTQLHILNIAPFGQQTGFPAELGHQLLHGKHSQNDDVEPKNKIQRLINESFTDQAAQVVLTKQGRKRVQIRRTRRAALRVLRADSSSSNLLPDVLPSCTCFKRSEIFCASCTSIFLTAYARIDDWLRSDLARSWHP